LDDDAVETRRHVRILTLDRAELAVRRVVVKLATKRAAEMAVTKAAATAAAAATTTAKAAAIKLAANVAATERGAAMSGVRGGEPRAVVHQLTHAANVVAREEQNVGRLHVLMHDAVLEHLHEAVTRLDQNELEQVRV